MTSTIFKGNTVYLINDDWNGIDPLDLTASLFRDEQMSLVKRSTRRSYSESLTCKLSYTVSLYGDALYSTQSCLRDLTTEKVIVPLWPAMQYWSDRATAPIGGGLMIVWKRDWSQYAIYAAGDPDPVWPAANDLWAPALMGFLNPTEPALKGPALASWTIDFTEASPKDYCLLPAAIALTDGPIPAGYAAAPKLLPFLPDFKNVSEQINVTVKREQMGFNRDQQTTFYPHTPWRVQRASYLLQDDQIGEMLRWFQDYGAPGSSFWASGWVQVARLTADIGAIDTVLDVTAPHSLRVDDYISVFGTGTFARKVTAKTDTTITIDSQLGTAQSASGACLFQLCLAKLTTPQITISWKRPGAAHTNLFWEELPTEVLVPGDETLGTTIGQLSKRVVLFHFWRDFRNGSKQHWYFTSFEKDLVWDAQTWSSAAGLSLGDISTSLNLEDDSCQFESSLVDAAGALFANNPLIDEAAGNSEVPLQMEVSFGVYNGAAVTSAALVFSGEVPDVSRAGNKLSCKGKFGSTLFDTNLPIFVRSIVCNHLKGSNDGTFLISAGCTLLKANWEFTAQVAAPLSVNYPFTIYLTNLARTVGAMPTFFANWFALGWIEWGAGVNLQRRAIVTSTNVVAGALQVNLHRYFKGVPNIGDTVKIYPGCDGTFATCKAYDVSTNAFGKFGNDLNFGANPFTPVADPSSSGQPTLNTRGGKK